MGCTYSPALALAWESWRASFYKSQSCRLIKAAISIFAYPHRKAEARSSPRRCACPTLNDDGRAFQPGQSTHD